MILILEIVRISKDRVERKDVTNGDNKEATLANAPLRKEDSFEVPKTIG